MVGFCSYRLAALARSLAQAQVPSTEPTQAKADASCALQLGVKAGVVFLSYSSLISGCDNGSTRIDQLMNWCGRDFEGLVIFDECHKAKNLVPESGAKPTKVGRMVLQLQQQLPQARVVYCSATGAASLALYCPTHLGALPHPQTCYCHTWGHAQSSLS